MKVAAAKTKFVLKRPLVVDELSTRNLKRCPTANQKKQLRTMHFMTPVLFNLNKVTNSKSKKSSLLSRSNLNVTCFFNPTQGAEQQMFKNQTFKLIQHGTCFFALIV